MPDDSAKPLGKEFGACLLLPCTKRQLSEKRTGRVLVFVIALNTIANRITLLRGKVNENCGGKVKK